MLFLLKKSLKNKINDHLSDDYKKYLYVSDKRSVCFKPTMLTLSPVLLRKYSSTSYMVLEYLLGSTGVLLKKDCGISHEGLPNSSERIGEQPSWGVTMVPN